MPKTHRFTDNLSGEPIEVVIDKIVTFEHEHVSECIALTLVGGRKIHVSETADQVREVIENADRA